MTAPTPLETARRVRELAPPLSADAARAYLGRIHEHGGDLDAFLAGMLAALDPESFLSRAAVHRAPEAPEEATGDRPGEISRGSGREVVLWFVRERLGLREDGEDAHREKWTGTYEDRTDEGEGVWIFFPRKPQADVRSKVKAAGFWYRGKNFGYGWQHGCGKGAKKRERAA